ncbi:ABC transporter substrate-binding protein [Oceanirhabdus sp. W0125-5]|uniref:ABC transporter substrate-binding protein n=1 Tax=Oceanirhabdus sp. W0125-5 TaxID=2999116 RepID=UPI0022F2F536|nr:spermidine/putrescine ABC transporter substrate-binding protein [Oceanirhabdus sp. W0125-5]WBW99330.1 spermidine/putrescine ABC transporter substrate-binding protein [Oceanirhabdus sp. W0125-5]
MKKSVLLIFSILMAVTLLVSCGGKEKEKLYVFNWGDYIDTELITKFEEETGIEIVYEEFSTNEEMYLKIKNGGSNYDIIIPSDYMISKMIKEGMLEELNYDNISNFKFIDEKFRDLPFDPNNKYSVPYTWGTLGVVYNPEVIKEGITSWEDLWKEEYKNEILMVDSMRDALVPALIKLGYSENTTDLKELEAARDELVRQMKLVNPIYVGDQGKTMLLQGEGSIFLTWSGEAGQIQANDDKFVYVIPKEGSNKWFDNMCIPKGAQNKEAAEKFIDFMTRPEVAAQNIEYIEYSTPNKEAFKLLSEEVQNNKTSYPDDEILEKCEVFIDLGDFVEEYNRVWTEVKVK